MRCEPFSCLLAKVSITLPALGDTGPWNTNPWQPPSELNPESPEPKGASWGFNVWQGRRLSPLFIAFVWPKTLNILPKLPPQGQSRTHATSSFLQKPLREPKPKVARLGEGSVWQGRTRCFTPNRSPYKSPSKSASPHPKPSDSTTQHRNSIHPTRKHPNPPQIKQTTQTLEKKPWFPKRDFSRRFSAFQQKTLSFAYMVWHKLRCCAHVIFKTLFQWYQPLPTRKLNTPILFISSFKQSHASSTDTFKLLKQKPETLRWRRSAKIPPTSPSFWWISFWTIDLDSQKILLTL